jgi:cystathionine beta-lyase/cystathionine gamma-synthase
MKLADIQGSTKITKENSFCSRQHILQKKPLNLGADIVMHSSYKEYLGGHSDVIAGTYRQR